MIVGKAETAVFALCVSLIGAGAASAVAAPVSPSGSPQSAITLADPINLQKMQDLDFGSLVVNAAGTATIDPSTSVVTTSAGVRLFGGIPRSAEFRINTNRSALFFIRLPSAPVTLRNVRDASAVMTVTDWTLDGSALRLKLGAGSLTFRVGGRLNVSANQSEGQYTGTFDVTAEYF